MCACMHGYRSVHAIVLCGGREQLLGIGSFLLVGYGVWVQVIQYATKCPPPEKSYLHAPYRFLHHFQRRLSEGAGRTGMWAADEDCGSRLSVT